MTPTLENYSEIVSDIPSGSISGIYILAFYLAPILTFYLALRVAFYPAICFSAWHSIWHSIYPAFGRVQACPHSVRSCPYGIL